MDVYKKIIVITIISLLFILSSCLYFLTRVRGCGDKEAINYNPFVNLHDKTLCKYKVIGCLDPKFSNYNKHATVSCIQDCKHCEPYNVNKNKTYKHRVDCKYCHLDDDYKGVTRCLKKQRCKIAKEGCTQPWSFNYDSSATMDNNTCINTVTLENSVQAMSSQERSVLVINKETVLNGGKDGLNIIIIKRDPQLTVKHNDNFNIDQSLNELIKLYHFLQDIQIDDLVIIISKGRTFNLFSQNLEIVDSINKELEKIGKRNKYFNPKSNYILMASKRDDLYFEKASLDTVFYPHIDFMNSECIKNRAIFLPTEDPTFTQEKVFDKDTKVRCALEALKYGTDKFGLHQEHCLMIPPNSKYEHINRSDCVDDSGSLESITMYEFKPHTSNIDIYKNKNVGVLVKFKNGQTKLYDNGDYKLKDQVESIFVPLHYALYTLTSRNKLRTYFGPITLDKIKDLDSIVVRKVLPNMSTFCDKENRCYVLGPGQHIIAPYLRMIIEKVRVNNRTKRIRIYQNSNFTSLIQEINPDRDGKIVKIDFPRLTRAIEILLKKID